MSRHVLLLRGINLGPSRRVPMADLRALLTEAGFDDVATHGQSGNIVLCSELDPVSLQDRAAELIAGRFGVTVPVLIRGADELAAVVAHDPLDGAAQDPRRYQVTFLAQAPPAEIVETLRGLATGSERLAVAGRELYSSHPDGIARSKLAARLTDTVLGESATVRNWATVTTLARLARG
jgi:uncharacterized protein (DUF1697 family)